ncbi:MAG: peptidase M64, partial [Ignavibacteriae bacterium]|nr:peptidase M64 [Ignavibacteriota bacterium]
YTAEEKEKYLNDLKRFTNIFKKQEPFKSYINNLNVYGIFKASEESGVDEPRANIYKNTTLNATFNSLGSERYLLTEDNKTLRDLASHVPYDAIYIMVNHKRYGGGGIYNWSCTFTADNQFQEYLFIHEFGHSFAGLADEYYTSDVAYNDFYKPTLEPVEPNVTALLDPENLKWKKLLTSGIELPTPWEKEEFDKTDYEWQKQRREMNDKIAELKRSNADKNLIIQAEQEYIVKDKERSDIVDQYLKNCANYGKVGAFEGAGYLQNGLYLPMIDCIMFSKGEKPFCKVCEEAIIKVIEHYGE